MKIFYVLLFSIIFYSFHTVNAGFDGMDGLDGTNGSHGRNGQNKTVTASQTITKLILSGRDGDDGSSGYNGGDATCFLSDEDSFDGGDGGNGGNGGDGGNGGKLTVYYENIQDIKNIIAYMHGGRAGDGAAGGFGGDGCNGGSDGYHGYTGRHGDDGNYGTIYLINRSTAIPEVTPNSSIYLAELENEEISLSSNIWEKNHNARELFNELSDIKNTYYLWKGNFNRKFKLNWEETRPISYFKDIKVFINIKNDKIDSTFNYNFWQKGIEETIGDLTTYTITDAIYSNEAMAIELGTINGEKEDLTLSVIDNKKISDKLITKFHLNLYVKKFFIGSKKIYSGLISSDFFTFTNEAFTIHLGKLPVDKKYLRKGKNLKIELKVKRRFGDNSLTKDLEASFKI